MTSSAKADTGVHCDPANAQDSQVITITQNSSGGFEASPNEACVTHNGEVQWTVTNTSWKWATWFVDDSSSPF